MSPADSGSVLVVAKAPVPGRVKTRLAEDVGAEAAAGLAAAALLDTLETAALAVGPSRCVLALDGSLSGAVDGQELTRAAAGWRILQQGPGTLGERLAQAHAGVQGPLVQVGMDTPQLTARQLRDLLDGLVRHDAVLAPAEDGGWWALALQEGRAAGPLARVTMSTPTVYDDTCSALRAAGLDVGASGCRLTDVDRLTDARDVASAAPATRFARRLAELVPDGVR